MSNETFVRKAPFIANKKSVFPKPRQDKEIPQTFVKHKV